MKLTADDRAALQCAIRVLTEILQQSLDEVPDIIHEWPTADSHLRGDFWKDCDGVVWGHGDGTWRIWIYHYRGWRWSEALFIQPMNAPFTRATDPSIPRTWDTLDDVPEDVKRVTGDYAGVRRELARSGLCESGWFQRAKGGPFSGWDDLFSGWMELSTSQTKHVKNIREEQ